MSPPTPRGASTSDAGWLCRSCACILRVPYRYPPSPWTYCCRCDGALTPDEQIVALARLQQDGVAPPLLFPRPADPAQAAGAEPALMQIPEVARFIGKKNAAIYKMIERGQLPGVTRIGRRLYIRRADLLRFLAEGRVPSPGRSR